MAAINPFDLLRDDDNEDLSQLLAAQQHNIASKKPSASAVAAVTQVPANLPSKPLPPAQAVREARDARNNAAAPRGGAGRGLGRGRGVRGGGIDFNRENANGNAGGASHGYEGVNGRVGKEDGEKERQPRPPYNGGRRGGYGGRGGSWNGDAGGDSERPLRRVYERRSGTGYGNEMKRDGSGRGNWGTTTDETSAQLEKEEIVDAHDTIVTEKQEKYEVPTPEVNKAGTVNEEEKEEDKEMTLEEYEKVKEEKRKALLALQSEERKVEFDEELQSMKQLLVKKENDEVFIKLGTGKDIGKKKENIGREEKSKKPMSITEFFKPTNGGGRYYAPGGRGRGRLRGGRGQQFGGNFDDGSSSPTAAPSIEDPGQFPTLNGK